MAAITLDKQARAVLQAATQVDVAGAKRTKSPRLQYLQGEFNALMAAYDTLADLAYAKR